MEIDTFHLAIILLILFVSGGGCAILAFRFWQSMEIMKGLRDDLATARLQTRESMHAKANLMAELEETKIALTNCMQSQGHHE
jgi:hypothetical protein